MSQTPSTSSVCARAESAPLCVPLPGLPKHEKHCGGSDLLDPGHPGHWLPSCSLPWSTAAWGRWPGGELGPEVQGVAAYICDQVRRELWVGLC